MILFGGDDPPDEGSIFGPRRGSWWVVSKLDPRWNGSGQARVGGFAMCAEAKAHVEAKKLELGDPPADLEHGYMKD
jgi:hypothetical protein